MFIVVSTAACCNSSNKSMLNNITNRCTYLITLVLIYRHSVTETTIVMRLWPEVCFPDVPKNNVSLHS